MKIRVAVPLVVLICILAGTAALSAPTTKEITLPGFKGSPIRPRISGDWVVWRQNETDKGCLSTAKGVVCYNLTTKETYTLYEGQSSLCNAGDGVAVWTGIKGKLADFVKGRTDYSDEQSNLIIVNLRTWQYYSPTLETGPAMGGAICGNYLVYMGQGGRNYLLDLSTGRQKRISAGENKVSGPQIYGDLVMWREYVNKVEIHGYSISRNQEFVVASVPGDELCIGGTDGKTIVWTDRKNQVWAYDIDTGDSGKVADGEAAEISDGIVAYCRARVVYGIDLSEGKEFRISSGTTDCAPAISRGRVMWTKGNKIIGAQLSSK